MSKTRSKCLCLRTSLVLAATILVSCVASTHKHCDAPTITSIIQNWSALTPSNLSSLDSNARVTTEHNRNRSGEATTNVHLGEVAGGECQCCATLVFASDHEAAMVAATVVRRFRTRKAALAYAKSAWHSFAQSDLLVDAKSFEEIADPYVARSSTRPHENGTFIADLRIELEPDSRIAVRVHVSQIDNLSNPN